MPSETIPNATVADVEEALAEQFGKTNIKMLHRSASEAAWMFRAGPKSPAKCTVSGAPTNTTITLSPHFPAWVIAIDVILIVIGCLLFIVPGLLLMAFVGIQYFVCKKCIGRGFPDMVKRLEEKARTRLMNNQPL